MRRTAKNMLTKRLIEGEREGEAVQGKAAKEFGG